jgi:ectoine hydroxylase-related dioxygenase (phytanoyl-CoA dioxygenase family)
LFGTFGGTQTEGIFMTVQNLIGEYERDGFVVVPGLLSNEKISQLIMSFRSVVSRLSGSNVMECSLDDVIQTYSSLRLSNPASAGAVYDSMTASLTVQSLFTSDEIVSKVSALMNIDEAELSHFFRCMRLDPPGENMNELGWHQDFQDSEHPSLSAIDGLTVWIPLTSVGPDEGSMEVCYGSHKHRIGAVKVEDTGSQNRSKTIVIDSSEADKFQRLVVDLHPGDAVFMNMNVLHRTYPAPASASWRFTVLGRYFNVASKDFLPGAQRYVPSKGL